MKNYGLLHFKNSDVHNFTTDFGIKLRKAIHSPLRVIFNCFTKVKIVIDHYPKLEKNKPYIFAALHNFVEDVPALLSTIDRSNYLLFGSTHQLERNKRMYGGWLNGFIYIYRDDNNSRKAAVKKMLRILKSGTSILIFPEASYNNTENLLALKLFSGPILLNEKTDIEIVPIAPFYNFGAKEAYMNVGEPLSFSEDVPAETRKRILRDTLATLHWKNMEHHAPRVKRKNLGTFPRYHFMMERLKEYQKLKWTKDVWDEEFTRYLDKADKEMRDTYESYEKIHVDAFTAPLIAPVLLRNQIERKYDFKAFIRANI